MDIVQGCPYIDKNMYLETQPERYKGFLSSDFSKTDEFSNTIRTEQYRDQLKVGALILHLGNSRRTLLSSTEVMSR